MVMIYAPLNGNNWLTWSQSVKIELEGKDKEGFIDGLEIKPAEGSAEYKQWRITDSVVELEARYGECDGPLLYKIQQQISSISEGNMSTLVLDPLPNVSKAYSMVLRVERQG
ncbi:hypothetical protein Sango_0359400 [Sesamum angolense]|uniref:Retrotransposon Copia-like N-terminal domain-containing protein n=1 Tax=Sesamum angolense TaxID=2727404 RepID=A0AAE1X9H2_9LAMI|nr:hypothetical protein Sango_0359400 [Sesamum angolense]